jgi:hypothetical protein
MDICHIYTNGAYLTPVKTEDNHWVWMVAEFVDDSFVDGQYIEPIEYADTLDDLLDYYEEEEEEQ